MRMILDQECGKIIAGVAAELRLKSYRGDTLQGRYVT